MSPKVSSTPLISIILIIREAIESNDTIIHVYANELEYNDNISTGKLTKSLQSGKDKTALMRSLLDRSSSNGVTVFIGDSVNDLGAMMTVDVGIVFGQDKTLLSFIKKLGIHTKPIKEYSLLDAVQYNTSVDKDRNRCLIVANAWQDIEQFLFGLQKSVDVPRVLIVAGSDSGAGAGIQADLKTCMATGSFGTTAITAVTSQNTLGVQSIHTIPPEHLRSQLDSILSDIGADVVKVGMLSSVEAVEILGEALKTCGNPPLIVDPVMVSTTGHELSSNVVAQSIVKVLFPMATVVSPNIPEACIISGRHITNISDMEAAAKEIKAMGPQLVLIKGGHLNEETIKDVLYNGETFEVIEHSKIQTDRLHGTGCTLASAIASGIAQGMKPVDATRFGIRYVEQALRGSLSMVLGTGKQLPFHHGTQWHPWPKRVRAELDVRLYGITDRNFDQKHKRSFVRSVREAIDGGATILQIREKDTDAVEFLEHVQIAMKLTASVPIIVNDRVDVAMAARADGVHVGQEDLPAATVRSMIGPEKILGVSVKSVEQAKAAEAAGADYLGVGAIFPTQTKASGVIGLDALTEISQSVSIPVVAIGGIQEHHVMDVIQHGARGIAVISAIFDTLNVCEAAKKLRRMIDDATL